MTENPFDDPRWKEFAKETNSRLVPMIRSSPVALAMIGPGDLDIQQCIEIGAILLLDKPLIIVVEAGAAVPSGLAKAAFAIIERRENDDEQTREAIRLALESIGED